MLPPTRDEIESRMLAFDSREDWLEARRATVGASEVASVLGRDPADPSGVRVFMAKTGRPLEVGADGDTLDFGNDVEPAIMTFAARKITAMAPGSQVVMYDRVILRHPTSRLHASPDALVFGPDNRLVAGLDAKHVREWMRRPAHRDPVDHWGEPGTDAVPRRVVDQCLASAGLFDVASWDVWAAIGGEPPAHYAIPGARPLFGRILAVVDAWWARHVETDTLPDPSSSGEIGARALAALYPATATLLETTPDAVAIGRALRDAKDARKAAEEAETAAANALKALMVAGKATGVAGVCTWNAVRGRESTDWPAVLDRIVARVTESIAGPYLASTADEARQAARRIVLDAVRAHTSRGSGHQALRLTLP